MLCSVYTEVIYLAEGEEVSKVTINHKDRSICKSESDST